MKQSFVMNVGFVQNGTSGLSILGRAARGGLTFPHAMYVENMYCHHYRGATTVSFKMLAYKNATTTIGNFLATTAAAGATTAGFKSITGTVSSPSLTASHRVWFKITKQHGSVNKIRVTLHLRKA
jgi:hypothetical protein